MQNIVNEKGVKLNVCCFEKFQAFWFSPNNFLYIFAASNVDKMRKTEAKKQVSPEVNPAPLPVKQTGKLPKQDLYIQPLTITFMVAKYTWSQQMLMASVMKTLQSTILKRLNNPSTPINQLELFPQMENHKIEIRLKLKDIINDPKQYDEFTKSYVEMADIPILLPYMTRDGQLGKRYSHLWDVIELPVKYNREISILMDEEIAYAFVDTTYKGYQRVLANVLVIAKDVYTNILYQLLNCWKSKGYFVISVKELRERLGVTDKYPRWADLKGKIILNVQKKLEKMYCEGNCELYFTLNQEHLQSQKGTPVTVRFDIISRPFFTEEFDRMVMATPERVEIRNLLVAEFKLEGESLYGILGKLDRPHEKQFLAFLKGNCRAAIKKYRSSIKSIPKYIESMCLNEIDKYVPYAEEVETEEPTQSEEVKMEKQPEIGNPDEVEIDEQAWNEFLKYCARKVGRADFDTWIKPIKRGTVQITNGMASIRLGVPNIFFYHHIDQNFSNHFFAIFQKLYKCQIDLIYQVIP